MAQFELERQLRKSLMKILIPIDGSDCSKAAVEAVASFAWEDNTEIRVYSVLEPISSMIDPSLVLYESKIIDELKEIQLDCSNEARARLQQNLPNCNVSASFGTGRVKDEIIEMAREWKPDLIVMGSHGRRGFEKFLLGSVAEAVVAHSPCSVEIVKLPVPEQEKTVETQTTRSAQVLMK